MRNTFIIYNTFTVKTCAIPYPHCLAPLSPQVTSQKEAASQAGVVFVALFPEHYSTLAGLRQVLAGKVLVDVSNAVQVNL